MRQMSPWGSRGEAVFFPFLSSVMDLIFNKMNMKFRVILQIDASEHTFGPGTHVLYEAENLYH